MQRPRLAVSADPAPVVETERDVARLLHLRQKNSFADGMHGPRGNENTVSRADFERMQASFEIACVEPAFQFAPIHFRLQPCIESAAWGRIEDHPSFGL